MTGDDAELLVVGEEGDDLRVGLVHADKRHLTNRDAFDHVTGLDIKQVHARVTDDQLDPSRLGTQLADALDGGGAHILAARAPHRH